MGGGPRLTYAELDAASDAWARDLARRGVGAGDLVALGFPRSAALVVGMLAVLKAGGAYVPLDVSAPPERLALTLRDASARHLLHDGRMALDDLPEGVEALAPPLEPGASSEPLFEGPARGGGDPAYVIHTSGSTGVPKGVIVPQRGVSRLVLGVDYARLDETRTLAMLAAPSFDASTFEVWGALLNGGRLAVVPGTGVPELSRLGALLAEARVTTLWLTAGLFDAVVDEAPAILSGVEEVLTGGEPLSAPHVARAQAALPGLRIVNGYGPTECTTFACCHPIPAGFDAGAATVPIGRPIAGTSAHVVDAALRPVPRGVPGELVLGGDGVALGYLGRDDLTAEAFVLDTVSGRPGGRLYRTGDLCRLRADGTLELLGRRDRQLKLRGFRVEPGEVEAAIEALPGVARAAAVGVGRGGGGRLAAFVLGEAGAAPTPEGLAAALRERLPRHLVPDLLRVVDALPITANGKLDRAALEAMASEPPPPSRPAPPSTETERALAASWTDVLGVPVTSIDQGFFDLGGHSLAALRLFDRIHQRLGVDLPMATLFAHPTIRELARVVDREAAAAPSARSAAAPWDTTVTLHPGPDAARRPLFVVGGLGGNANHLIEFGRAMGATRPVVAFQARGIMGHEPHGSVEEMAADNIAWMRRHQPAGPYRLAGYSAGSFVAFEMARQLEAAGIEVADLVILDAYAPGFAEAAGIAGPGGAKPAMEVWDRVVEEFPQMFGGGRRYFLKRAQGVLAQRFSRGWAVSRLARMSPGFLRIHRAVEAWIEASGRYRGGPYGGRAMLVLSTSPLPRERRIVAEHPDVGWSRLVDPARLHVPVMACNHVEMVRGAHAAELARLVEARVEKARGATAQVEMARAEP